MSEDRPIWMNQDAGIKMPFVILDEYTGPPRTGPDIEVIYDSLTDVPGKFTFTATKRRLPRKLKKKLKSIIKNGDGRQWLKAVDKLYGMHLTVTIS